MSGDTTRDANTGASTRNVGANANVGGSDAKENLSNSKWELKIDSKQWLSLLPDDTPLVEIPVIPGTHNSATQLPRSGKYKLAWPWAQCQDLNIRQQFDIGIRELDLRLHYHRAKNAKAKNKTSKSSGKGSGSDTGNGGSEDEADADAISGGDADVDTPAPGAADSRGNALLQISHRFPSDQTFVGVIDTAVEFLTANPSEFLVLRFKRDWHSRDQWPPHAQELVKQAIHRVPPKMRTVGECNGLHPLRHFRGKVVFVCPDWGIQVGSEGFERNMLLCQGRLDVWDSKTRRQAKVLVEGHAYRYFPLLRHAIRAGKDAELTHRQVLKGNIRSVGANVVVAALTPRAVSKDMNKWLHELFAAEINRLQASTGIAGKPASSAIGGGGGDAAAHSDGRSADGATTAPRAKSGSSPNSQYPKGNNSGDTVDSENGHRPWAHFGFLAIDFCTPSLVEAMLRYSCHRILHPALLCQRLVAAAEREEHRQVDLSASK